MNSEINDGDHKLIQMEDVADLQVNKTQLSDIDSNTFRGISNVLFTEDLLSDDPVNVDVSDTLPLSKLEEFDLAQWKSVAPFSFGVRIAEYNQPSNDRFHMSQFPLSFVEFSYKRLEPLLKKYEQFGLRNKTAHLIWKDHVKRPYVNVT